MASAAGVKADVNPTGGISLDPRFFVEFGEGLRSHRLQGGDASSDSFCFPS